MGTEVTCILGGEVHLIVIGTYHHTADIVTVGVLDTVEVGSIQIVILAVFHACRHIHVVTRTITAVHCVERIGRTVLIGLVGIDTL